MATPRRSSICSNGRPKRASMWNTQARAEQDCTIEKSESSFGPCAGGLESKEPMIGLPTRTLLVVEDNPDDESLTLRAIKRSAIENPIVVARDGEEAIKVLADPAAHELALVLLDLKLPKRNGFEIIQHIRNQPHTRLVPVVVLTSSDEES